MKGPKSRNERTSKRRRKTFPKKKPPFKASSYWAARRDPLTGQMGSWGRKTHYCFQILSPLSVFFAGWCLLLIKWDFPYTRAGTPTHKVKHGPTRQKGRKGLFLRLFFWGAWFTAGLTFPSKTVQHFSWSGKFSLWDKINLQTGQFLGWFDLFIVFLFS